MKNSTKLFVGLLLFIAIGWSLDNSGGVFGPAAGPRDVVIVFEEDDMPVSFTGQFRTELRDGPAADYLLSKKHRLTIIDDDTEDETGNVSTIVTQALKDANGKAEPIMRIADKASGKVLIVESLKPSVTSTEAIELIKKHGG